MECDSKLYVPQSGKTSAKAYSYCANEVLRVSSGNEQISDSHKITELLKVKSEDTSHVASKRRKPNVNSARVAVRSEHRQKKRSSQRRLNVRNAVENEDEGLDFAGLGPAELQSPRYIEYRRKQQERENANGPESLVWPAYMEHAFQLALRAVPPVGRKKKQIGEKLCGRNEEISLKIRQWTGVERIRKQISSHIQVLKAFMPENHEWLQNVVPNENTSETLSFPELDVANLRDDQIDSYIRSCYGPVGQPANSSGQFIPPPDGILRSNAPVRGPYVNRIEFEMFVLSPTKKQTLHTYTSNQTDIGAPSRALEEEIPHWYTSYPQLEHYYEQGQLDCEIILIESNLNLLGETPPKHSSLSIGFNVNIAAVSREDQWAIKTNYYEYNGQPVDMKSYCASSKSYKTTEWDKPSVFQVKSDVNLEIPLQSAWWVQLFHGMAVRKQRMRHDPFLMKQEEEESRRYLEEMSIMQEVRRISADSHSRVAIILWKISATQSSQTGITTWRKLKPPPARFQINSPIPSPPLPLQHSMVLNSTIQTLAMPQPMSVHAERFLQHSSMFIDDSIVNDVPSSEGSPSPGFSPDYTHSFPSSTTTSFPSSVTHGFLPHEESQESACYSQEQHPFRQDSFASQSSYVRSQITAHTYEEAATTDERLRYLSQQSALELPDPAFFSHETLEPMSHYQSPSPQYKFYDEKERNQDETIDRYDFSGGHIQLSFQQKGDAEYPNPPPYIATAMQLLQTEHHRQPESQTRDGDARSPAYGLAHVTTDASNAGHAQSVDFDFSSLETHFTLEELAAIRSHDFDEYQVQTTTSIEHSVLIKAVQHSDEAAVQESQAEGGAVLGEIVDEENLEEAALNAANEEFEFEEIHLEEDDGDQTLRGQGHGIGIDYNHEIEDIGLFEEDHL
ncbi:MAG: hypothetical protein Q9218_000386 [Villophora microphyllina]